MGLKELLRREPPYIPQPVGPPRKMVDLAKQVRQTGSHICHHEPPVDHPWMRLGANQLNIESRNPLDGADGGCVQIEADRYQSLSLVGIVRNGHHG